MLVGSWAGDHVTVEHVVWSEKDRCHYFYLTGLSRGYRADELRRLGGADSGENECSRTDADEEGGTDGVHAGRIGCMVRFLE